MKQFKTDIYENLPPFACCLYHKELMPKDQSFLDMLRFTFIPYFSLYSFTFFWTITTGFVYLYSLFLTQGSGSGRENQFLYVSQGALFELGQNYPFYIVKQYHYYRLFTSMVLSINLYHFVVATIGILVFGSYIEELVGFKRVFLLTITCGVGGEIMRNVFIQSATIQSLTPICGLIGYLFGLYLAHASTSWRYCKNEKSNMILVTVMVLIPYFRLATQNRNISLVSMLFAMLIGFIFYFCDPAQRYVYLKFPSIIVLVSMISISTLWLFFKTDPLLLYI